MPMATSSPPPSVTRSYSKMCLSKIPCLCHVGKGRKQGKRQTLPSLCQADTDTLISSDIKRPKSKTGPSGHIIFSHSKDAPYSCCWPSMGEETQLIPERLGASKVPSLTPFFPCLQTAVPGADWPTQLPPGTGGFCGDLHQEPQPDALRQRSDCESL